MISISRKEFLWLAKDRQQEARKKAARNGLVAQNGVVAIRESSGVIHSTGCRLRGTQKGFMSRTGVCVGRRKPIAAAEIHAISSSRSISEVCGAGVCGMLQAPLAKPDMLVGILSGEADLGGVSCRTDDSGYSGRDL